jgi:hypothetical protein
MKFGQIIDRIGESLGRIKTVGLVVVIVLLGLSIMRTGCDRDDMEELVERVTGLNVRNDILNEDIKERDSLLIAKDLRIIRLNDSLQTSEGRIRGLNRVYSDLEEEYQSLSDSLLTIPTDSSYTFLTEEAYPYDGELKYPFNEPQVKGIHLTFLETFTLADMNTVLNDKISELIFGGEIKDSIKVEYMTSMALLKADTTDMRKIIGNQDQIIDAQGDHIQDQKRKKTIWQIIGGAIIVILAAFAAAG